MGDAPIDDYLHQESLQLVDHLGNGKDGIVIQTSRPSAVKFLYVDEVYRRELRMYRCLREKNIDKISCFKLPRLIKHDDRLRAIEMTIVSAPYMLDFASSYDELDLAHLDYSDEVWSEREQHWLEMFEHDWPLVRDARDEMTRLTGLMLLDLTLNNIRVR